MITKLTSVQSIIAKVIADLDLQEDELKISDTIEWCGEAIEKIGAVTQFIPKVTGQNGIPALQIHNHQAPLPCDLHQLHQVAYSWDNKGPWFPMRKATGSFAVWGNDDPCNHEELTPDNIVKNDTLVNLVVDMYGNIDKTEAIEMINSNQNLRTILTNLLKHHNHIFHHKGVDSANPSIGLQYSIKPGWIMCNVPAGYLKLSYSGIPTDENGYPLVPDMTSYREAIYWYITMKLKYPEYLRGTLNRDVYYDIKRSWNFYRQQAYAEALMPNEDGLESIKNNWNKIVPEYRDHSTFYSHTGERQVIYNANT
jgi:hypothetical protein